MDNVLLYTCRASGNGKTAPSDESGKRDVIPGTYQELAPPPLLQNWGEAGSFPYMGDIAVSCPNHNLLH
jgi:hypothetical protein